MMQPHLLRQNQQLKLQVYTLNTTLLKYKQTVANLQQELQGTTEENTQLTTEIVQLQHRIADLEVTVLAMER
jgi:regulator of replication initiation timing